MASPTNLPDQSHNAPNEAASPPTNLPNIAGPSQEDKLISTPPISPRNSPPLQHLPPPSEAIPLGLGPDGLSLLPKLELNGQPRKSPPLDKEGKPFPPPPILGPNGEIIPRPTDDNGRPLPIYVYADGRPILDRDGKPIPLRLNQDGKPIPLEVDILSASPSQEHVTEGGKRVSMEVPPLPPTGDGDKVEQNMKIDSQIQKLVSCAVYSSIFDIIFSLLVAAILSSMMIYAHLDFEPDPTLWLFYMGSAIASFVGAVMGGVPILAVKIVKKNQSAFLMLWLSTTICFCVVELLLLFLRPKHPYDDDYWFRNRILNSLPSILCAARLLLVIFTILLPLYCTCSDEKTSANQQRQEGYLPKDAYPRENMDYYHYNQQQAASPQMTLQGTPSTMMIQQPVVQQPVVVLQQPYMQPTYSFSHAIPMSPYYGGMYPMTGGMCGGYGGYHHGYCPYYDWGWGW